MDPFQHIELRIVSNDRNLRLYDDPDAENNAGQWARNHYIEAVTGATFRIEVIIGSLYDISQLQGMDCVRVTVDYDGSSRCKCDISKKEIDHDRRASKETIATFARTYRTDPVTKQCLAGDTTFGSLNISEPLNQLFERSSPKDHCRGRYRYQASTRRAEQAGESSNIHLAISKDQPSTSKGGGWPQQARNN